MEQAGHTAEFESFYNATSDSLYRYCYFKSGSHDIALDIAEESFVRIYQRWDNYESGDHRIRALYTIARNLIYDHFRSHKRDVSLEATEREYTDEGMGAGAAIDAHIAQTHLARALSHLNDTEREIITRHTINEVSYRQLSIELQKPEPTIRKMHSRALGSLTKIFQQLYGKDYQPY